MIDAPVYDAMGRPGIVGDLDNRMWEKYGQTFILSAFSGLALTLSSKTPTTDDTNNFTNYTALNMLDLSSQMLKETINLAPVVTVPSSTRILVRLPTTINFNTQAPAQDN